MADLGYEGIPDPESPTSELTSLGMATWPYHPPTEAHAALPSPWTSNQTGFYFVESGGGDGGNGNPTSPRGSFPASPSAGDVIVVSDAGGTFSGQSLNWTGSSGSPIFMVANAGDSPRFTSAFSIAGAYTIFDGLEFVGNGDAMYTPTANFHTLRNSYVRDTNTSTGRCLGTTSNLFLYNVEVDAMDSGTWPLSYEDHHGIKVSVNNDNVWIIDCHIHHVQGDSIQIANEGDGPDNTKLIFIAGNEMHHCYQTGGWDKDSSDVIWSTNWMYSNYNDGGSVSAGSGLQSRCHWVTWVNNLIDDNGGGFQIQANNSSPNDTDNLRMVGNIIIHSTGENFTSGNAHTTSGFTHRSDTPSDVWFCYNTVYDFTDDIHVVKNGVHVYGNYLGAPTDNYHILGADGQTVNCDYNFFHGGSILSNNVTLSPNTNSITSTTPNFVNAAGDDFTPDTGSVLIGAVPDSGVYDDVFDDFNARYGLTLTNDRAGNPRFAEGGFAMGALGPASGGGGGSGDISCGDLTVASLVIG